MLGSHNYKKYVIITRARTGSNLLVSLLASHSNIHSYGEIFRRTDVHSCTKLWHQTFSKKISYVKCVGFKIFYDHPLQSEDKEIWEKLLADKEIRIIHLIRENLVRAELSLLIARKTQMWGANASSPKVSLENRRVHIDTVKFLKKLEMSRKEEEMTRKRFSSHPFLEISYEELVSERNLTMEKVFHFLDVIPRSTRSNFIKQNTESIDNLVINYEELRNKLKGTEFESQLV